MYTHRSLSYTKDSLLKFKEEKAKRELADKQAQDGGGEGFGGFGGFGGEGEKEEEVIIKCTTN